MQSFGVVLIQNCHVYHSVQSSQLFANIHIYDTVPRRIRVFGCMLSFCIYKSSHKKTSLQNITHEKDKCIKVVRNSKLYCATDSSTQCLKENA